MSIYALYYQFYYNILYAWKYIFNFSKCIFVFLKLKFPQENIVHKKESIETTINVVYQYSLIIYLIVKLTITHILLNKFLIIILYFNHLNLLAITHKISNVSPNNTNIVRHPTHV